MRIEVTAVVAHVAACTVAQRQQTPSTTQRETKYNWLVRVACSADNGTNMLTAVILE